MSPTASPSWRVRANFWTGWRAVGGRLTLGEDDLVFEPHAFDRSLGGGSFRTPIRDIISIDVGRRGAVPRKRLFVRTRHGIESAFLVPKVDDRASDIRRAIADSERT